MSRAPLWALVPVKSFDRGKSRLRPALADRERIAFARATFEHVLAALAACDRIAGTLVATDSPAVAAAARARGAHTRLDPPAASSLAVVVDAGLADLAARGAAAALVLMADLPGLEPDDVAALAAALDSHDAVLVRAGDGHHTNALGLAPPTALATAFGRPDSFAAHLARAAHLRVAVLDNPRVAFDVDGPEDHARLRAAGAQLDAIGRR